MITLKKPLVLLALIALLSCGSDDGDEKPAGGGGGGDDELSSLPADTGGTQTQIQKGTTDTEFGYLLYLPGGYDANTKSYPLLIFLHGQGERGNGTTDLVKLENAGGSIPNLIKNGKWVGKASAPMIVASPQYHPKDGKGNEYNWGEMRPAELKGFIEHMMKTYRVNAKRIYLTGLSHGGTGVIDYIVLEDDATSHVAAAVPVAAYGYGDNGVKYNRADNTPIWMFVGDNDGINTQSCPKFLTKYNALSPAPTYPAKLTMYDATGHNCWTKTYDLTGMTAVTEDGFDDYNMNIYDWMLQYKRSD